MREMDAFEQAYKNGFAAGMKAAEEKIVRCKDCKYGELEFFVDNGTIVIEEYKCGNPLCVGKAQQVSADDFCSCGERRSDG